MTIPVPLMTGCNRLARSCSIAPRTRSTIDLKSGVLAFARTRESCRRTRSTTNGRGKSQCPSASRTLLTAGIFRRGKVFSLSCILVDGGGGPERFAQLQRHTASVFSLEFPGPSPAWLRQHKAIIRHWSAHQLIEFCTSRPHARCQSTFDGGGGNAGPKWFREYEQIARTRVCIGCDSANIDNSGDGETINRFGMANGMTADD